MLTLQITLGLFLGLILYRVADELYTRWRWRFLNKTVKRSALSSLRIYAEAMIPALVFAATICAASVIVKRFGPRE